MRVKLLEATARKKRLGYRYLDGDIAWDQRATVIYPLLCIGAGMTAGMFGIGGGIVQVTEDDCCSFFLVLFGPVWMSL